MEYKHKSRNVSVVLEILKDEVDGDIASAFTKMTDDYSMTWMYCHGDELFPTSGKELETAWAEVYSIRNREYDIRNIAEGENLVMLELIESYPDPNSGKMYRTPLILVLEMENGKIRKGRHYCDPRLSFLRLSKRQIECGLQGTDAKIIVH